MTKLPDWERRMSEVVESHRDRPFKWGGSDCFVFVMDVINAETGNNPGLNFLGKYTTEAGAAKVLLSLGFRDIGEALASILPEIPPSFASRGDIVTVEQDDRTAAAVCIGASVVGKSVEGLTFLSRLHAKRAFKVK